MRVYSSYLGANYIHADGVASGTLPGWRGRAVGMTVIELLVVIAVISILMALLLPAVQYCREMARRFSCQNNLHQLGLGLHQYHDANGAFPPGCIGDESHLVSAQAWGWGVLILPYLEQRLVYDQLRPDANSLAGDLNNVTRQSALRSPLRVFRCPSDLSDAEAHSYRLLDGFVLSVVSSTTAVHAGEADSELVMNRVSGTHLAGVTSSGLRVPIAVGNDGVLPGVPIIWGHLGHGSPRGLSPPTPAAAPLHRTPPHGRGAGAGVFGVPTSRSNYVGSFGDAWQPNCGTGDPFESRGNGIFGSFSKVGLQDLIDGSSNTFMVGERSSKSYAAVWAGVNSWVGFDTQGISMVMGTAAYPLNDVPNSYNLSCDGQGSAGFGSAHTGGALFLFADGSVRFVSDQIQFQSSPRGAYQRLACRNDGEVASSP